LYFFATFTMLYAGTFTIHADKRSDCSTFFASMSEEALAADSGPDVKQLGRWHNLADGSGFFVCEAKSVTALHEWMWKWSEDMVTIKVSPMVDDDTAKEVVLGTKPAFSVSLDNLDDDPRDGESIYIVQWKVHPEHKLETYEKYAGMTEEEETKDHGKCRYLGRFHDMCAGTGFCVAAAKNEIDLYKWAYNWAGTIDLTWVPVVKDKTAQEIIKKKYGYDDKLASLMENMKVV
jgi:hypothetical protein